MEQPDDKPKKTEEAFEDPRLFVVIGEESFPITGMETAFVDYSKMNVSDSEDFYTHSSCLCNLVKTQVCTCNKMRPVCNCNGYVSSSSSRGRGGSGCRCAPVH